MKRSTLALALGLCACNPNKTALDANYHPTERNWGSLQPVWRDEFDDPTITSPDPKKWVIAEFCGGYNGEQQCYTPQNAVVANGYLTITAKPDSCSGSSIGQAEQNNEQGSVTCSGLPGPDYSSARLHTRVFTPPGPYAWKYGRVEIRAKLPYGQGTWPAFWMMPYPEKYGVWPGSGEIDIMETANLRTVSVPKDFIQSNVHVCSKASNFWDSSPPANAVTNCIIYSNIHGDGPNTNSHHKASSEKKLFPYDANGCPEDLVNRFHTYALEWNDFDLRFYIDDQLVQQLPHVVINGFPFREPFYLIINLAVGGGMAQSINTGGWLGASTASPSAKLVLDWIRVYECVPDATAKKCIYDGQGLGRKPPAGIPVLICFPDHNEATQRHPVRRRERAALGSLTLSIGDRQSGY